MKGLPSFSAWNHKAGFEHVTYAEVWMLEVPNLTLVVLPLPVGETRCHQQAIVSMIGPHPDLSLVIGGAFLGKCICLAQESSQEECEAITADFCISAHQFE